MLRVDNHFILIVFISCLVFLNIVISGCIGPRGDGYHPDFMMTADDAKAYHQVQIEAFKETEADMVAAFTISYIAEGTGIALAAKSSNIPAVISFTVETNGRLPSGEVLRDAVVAIDKATDNFPSYYMINCAHPSHFKDVLDDGGWKNRIKAIRANASSKSHEELDDATELDEGNPKDLAIEYRGLMDKLGSLNIFGGCCGTDDKHIALILKEIIKN